MSTTEIEVNVNTIASMIRESGIQSLTGVNVTVGKTRAGADRLEITGPAKTFSLDNGNGLGQVQQGDLRLLIDRLAAAATVLPGNFSAPKLLEEERLKRSCFTELGTLGNIPPNILTAELLGEVSDQIPVFYGSTAGINFAEVLETALCAKALASRGIRARVIFDFDSAPGGESDHIFYDSMAVLPASLREKAANFNQSTERGLMAGRLQAVRELLGQVEGLPEVTLIDGRQIFEKLGKRFTLGQLLVLARLAGNDPRLFEVGNTLISARTLMSEMGSLELLAKPVSEFIAAGAKPAGFTYYAREAVTGTLGGVSGRPLKLTEKANIYKIMLSTTALFDEQAGQGTIFLPISRFRITAAISGRPVDPIALKILADESPRSFAALIRDFQDTFRVLTPEEAKTEGTADKKFTVGEYFNLEEKDEA